MGVFSDFKIPMPSSVNSRSEATSKGPLNLGENVLKLYGNQIRDNLIKDPIFGKAFEIELNSNTSTTHTPAFAGLNAELNSISIQSTFSNPKATKKSPEEVMAEHFLKITPGATSNEITQMSAISNTVFADSMPGKIGKAVLASTDVQNSLSTDDFPSTLDTHFKAHDLLTLTNFGCKEHNVGLNVYKEENGKFTVVLCNRGFGSKDGMFLEKTLDSIETCKQFLNTLKERKKEENMDNVVNQFRTNGNLNSIYKDLQQGQVTGNCGWANKAAALKELSNRRASVDDYKTFRSQMQEKVKSDIEILGNEELKMALELRTLIKERTGPIKLELKKLELKKLELKKLELKKLELKKLENDGELSDMDFNGLSRQLTDDINTFLPTLLSDKENSSLDHAKPILKRYQQFVKLGLDLSKPGPNNKFLVNTYNFLNTLDTKELQSAFDTICNDRIEDSMPKFTTKEGELRKPPNFINDIQNKMQNFDDKTLQQPLQEKVKEFSVKYGFCNTIEKEDGKISYRWISKSERSLEAEVLFKLSQSKSNEDADTAINDYEYRKNIQDQLETGIKKTKSYDLLNPKNTQNSQQGVTLKTLYEDGNAAALNQFKDYLKNDFNGKISAQEEQKSGQIWRLTPGNPEDKLIFDIHNANNFDDATVAFDSYNKLKDFQKQLNQEGIKYESLNEASLTSLYEPENAVGLQLFREQIKTDFENPEKYDGKINDNVWTTTNENKWLFNLYTAKNATEAQSALNSRSTT